MSAHPHPQDPAPSHGAAGGANRTVASFRRYEEAERAVDHLADNRFPVERVAIVGRDLRFVEQVTGRLGHGDAALNGGISGALVGALVGWLFGVFDWFEPLLAAAWLAFQGLWFGALVGALIGLGVHALKRGRRDFASIPAMRADRYEVVADAEVADEAARLLADLEQPKPVEPVPTG
jgi:hypothetical protein